MLTELESRWLREWARPIVGVSPKHRQDCSSLGGSSGEPNLNSKIRFPGYFGEDFESSRVRVLCVGQIHNAAVLYRTLGRSLQDSMASWTPGDVINDKKFLRSLQEKYQEAIKGWGPWKNTFGKIISLHGLDERKIAYTNFAKCWQKPRHLPMYPVLKCCEQQFPIKNLVRLLQIDVILEITKTPERDAGVKCWGIDERNVLKLSGLPRQNCISEARRSFDEMYQRALTNLSTHAFISCASHVS